MNKYDEVKERHQKIVNEFPMKFAFSDEQFNQSMKELGLNPKDTDKVISIGEGGFIRKTDVKKFSDMWDTLRKEHNDLIKADKTGEGYIKDMFVSELENHEYGYTYELDETLDALELTREQISKSPTLSHGLELARKEVLKKESEVDYEYE
jgi:hypothetical protein